jgi:hypothetical protein
MKNNLFDKKKKLIEFDDLHDLHCVFEQVDSSSLEFFFLIKCFFFTDFIL